uniref:Flippase-like domain-containing protein n=1 Tax=uncultured bacterium CSL1 TaxID=1091565 RepID=G4WVB3_9BACT|nr:hypothetical protein [uncultured bacterium CSL1]
MQATENQKSHSGWKRWTWVPKLALTLVALGFVLKSVDVAQLREMVTRQDHSMIIAVAALGLLQMWLGSVRWQIILCKLAKAPRALPSHRRIATVYYISMFFNTCLPGTVGGDVVRVWLAKGEGVPMSLAIHSIVIDRMITLFGLLIMVFIVLPYVCQRAGTDPWMIMGPLALLPIVGGAFLLGMHRMPRRFCESKIGGWALQLAGSVRQVFMNPLTCLMATTLVILGHSTFCMMAYLLAQSLNIDLTLVEALMYIPIVMLVTVLPISIGGWGVREAGMVALLGLSGIPAGSAVVLSVQLALVIIMIGLPGGILWLLRRSSARAEASLKDNRS